MGIFDLIKAITSALSCTVHLKLIHTVKSTNCYAMLVVTQTVSSRCLSFNKVFSLMMYEPAQELANNPAPLANGHSHEIAALSQQQRFNNLIDCT